MAPNRKKEHPGSREDQSSRESAIHQKAHFFFLYSVDCSILLLDLSSVLVSFCTLICRSRLCAVAFSNHLFSPVSPTTWLSTRS